MTPSRWQVVLRNAVSLMMTTGLTSVLGFAFWLIAARLYTAEVVGASSAYISLATLVATIASLNLGAVLTRLVPKSGVKTRWFVLRSYAITTVLTVLLGLAVVASNIGEPYLGSTLTERLPFVFAAVMLLLFVLQDAVLTGLSKGPAVLIENALFAVVKLLALVALAASFPTSGIVVSWIAPALMAVVAVNVYLFAVVIPRHEAEASGEGVLPRRRRLASFVSAEYMRALLTTGTSSVLPLLVTAAVGPVQTAYFWIPWLIYSSAVQLPYGIMSAYVVDVSFHGRETWSTLRRGIRMGAAVVAATTVGAFFIVPVVLQLAGPGYAEEGSSLSQVLSLCLPFSAVVALYATFAWLDQRLWKLVSFQAITTVVLLGGSWLLIDDVGIVAVGYVMLVTQVGFAIALLPSSLRRIRAVRASGEQGLPLTRGVHDVSLVHEADGVSWENVAQDRD